MELFWRFLLAITLIVLLCDKINQLIYSGQTLVFDNAIEQSPLPKPSLLPMSNEEINKISALRKDSGGYGGVGDQEHLGGFTDFDKHGISNNTFNFMMGPLGVKSLIDVGCGKGFSTKHFLDFGANVLCVEGSRDAIKQSLLPKELIIEHDYTLGPWWPSTTYDAAWAVEFLEHVGRQYSVNYIKTFQKSALLFVTHSAWGGWHHVEVHGMWWWKSRLQAYGFIYSEDLTQKIRSYARREIDEYGQHIWFSMMVFINPVVASLPQHQHLFNGHGCYKDIGDRDNFFNEIDGEPCIGRDALPASYRPLLDCAMGKKKTDLWKCTRTNLSRSH